MTISMLKRLLKNSMVMLRSKRNDIHGERCWEIKYKKGFNIFVILIWEDEIIKNEN